MDKYTEINSKTWDVWSKNGNCWSIPVTHEVFVDVRDGKWDVVLTPCKPVPKRWFEPFIKNNRLEGAKLLGLASGGVLLAGMDNGFNFIVEDFTVRPLVITHKLPYNPLRMSEEDFQKMADNDEGIQFSHTLEEQIGGQIKAGFILSDVFEDFNEDPDAISDGIPAYWASRAVKPFGTENGMICIRRSDNE